MFSVSIRCCGVFAHVFAHKANRGRLSRKPFLLNLSGFGISSHEV